VPAPAGTLDEHADDENHPLSGQAKFSLVQAMSSMMALGLKLEQVGWPINKTLSLPQA
jgi:dihydroorotase